MEVEVNTGISETLKKELEWFDKVVDLALTLYFKNESEIRDVFEIELPYLDSDTAYSKIIHEHQFGFEERLILILGLAPVLRPQSLDVFKIKNTNLNTDFSEFGGLRENDQGFIPTIETAFFILSGDNLERRINLLSGITHNHDLFKSGVLDRSADKDILKQPIELSSQFLKLILSGKEALPEFGSKFPAQQIFSAHSWDDLIVDDSVNLLLGEISDWLKFRNLILNDWEFEGALKKGYRALFYGPPGTGKTMAAALLGKSCESPVFRVDLSMIVSKYIGETEKNLSSLFDLAEGNDWILFFDEADSLFGKRTQTKGSNDRYANQEVSYLLQRIEDFPGLVILATNLKDNIDEAFSRRFQSVVQFNKPSKKERKKLWENYLFSKFELDKEIEIEEIVNNYEITGGEILNILRYCTIKAAKRDERKLFQSDILGGIKREYDKTNKTF